jgi:serine/threonine protein kinase
MVRAAGAHGHVHSNVIVHRDLEPANVLVTNATDRGMRVKITECGISLAARC